MHHLAAAALLGLLTLGVGFGCQEQQAVSSIDPVNWAKRSVSTLPVKDSVEGRTYLSVYSSIYSRSEHTVHDLTVTVSMRNASLTDTVYIRVADFHATDGSIIRSYLERPIWIAPMETVEIVIDEQDASGETGANFFFEWAKPAGAHDPLFEGVMISTSGQQGLSFSTQGRHL